MEKPGNQNQTVVDNQRLAIKEKLEKKFSHLDLSDIPDLCPIRDVLAPVIDKWSILIFMFLGAYSCLRFNELKKYLYGVSSKSLTERLKALERDGYIDRKMYAEVPIRVEYSLTEYGYQFLEKMIHLLEWIDMHAPEVVKKRIQYDQLIKKKNKSKD